MEIIDALEAIVKSGHASDEKLLNLSKSIIETVKLLQAVVRAQSDKIRKLEERHDALLHAFYSHCEQVSQEEIH